jgi:hypothetical protein
MKNSFWIVPSIIFLLLFIPFTYAVQPTQQYYKSYITPFYRDSMVLNTNYTYNLTVNPPDGIHSVTSAIINFNGQINGQTQTFTLWINGQSCNNPTYSVATSFSTTGNVQFAFDCSNRIIKSGIYNITLRSAVNTGAMQGWLDLTYMNNPLGSTDIFGTEYTEGDDGTIFLLLKDNNGIPISNATCTLDIYYPNIANQTHPEWINNGLMMYKEEGLYYYDFTVPLLTGLYMVNAQCTYLTSSNYYYTLSSGLSPTRNVTYGTYTGDTFVLNDYQEWLYTECDSSTGSPKSCDSWSQWNLSSSIMGNITQLFVQYLGENNGAGILYMYYWNWSTNNWIQLSNSLTFHSTASTGVPSGVDEYLSNNIPLTGIGNGSNNGLVRIRLNTTAGSSFKQFNNWLQLRAIQYSTSIQDLKGSGEIHVNSAPAGLNRFFKVLTCDGFIDGRCGIFASDTEYNLAEGVIIDYLNISATSTKSDVSISYSTPFSVDCSALYHVQEWNGTGWQEFNDYSLYSQPAYENCIITLLKNIDSSTEYQFKFIYDNYMKWEVGYSKVIADAVNMSLNGLCNGRNFTYINPINSSTILPTDLTTKMCYQGYDDEYWFNSYYTDSLSVFTSGEFASYVQESRFYRKEFYDRYMWLTIGNNTNLMSDYYADKVWNHNIRNLTYYQNFTISQSDLTNYSKISDMVWNATTRNLTYYNMSDTTNYTLIKNNQYNYTPNFDMIQLNFTQLSIKLDNILLNLSNILTQILNIPLNVWNYATRNLTYYPTTIINTSIVSVNNYSVNNVSVNVQNVSVNINNYSVQNITVNVNNITNSVNNYTINVDNYTINVNNYSVNTQNVTVLNYTINVSTDVVNVNNYTINVNNYTFNVNNYSVNTINVTVLNYTISVDNYSVQNVSINVNNYTILIDNVTVNTSDIINGVWNYTNRTLTYYELDNDTDLTNYTLITDNVWNYTARYTHGVILN